MIRVIIVDDETDLFPLFKIKFKREIRKNLIKFDFFTSAREALDFLKDNPGEKFQFILSDLNMPEINGIGLLERIKEEHKEQKVFMISAAGEDDFKNEAQNKGADGYFTKPIDFENLKRLFLPA